MIQETVFRLRGFETPIAVCNESHRFILAEHLLYLEVLRPRGKCDSIVNGNRYQVKRINVKPEASLSKQMYHHCTEHWVLVSGTAIDDVDDKETVLAEKGFQWVQTQRDCNIIAATKDVYEYRVEAV